MPFQRGDGSSSDQTEQGSAEASSSSPQPKDANRVVDNDNDDTSEQDTMVHLHWSRANLQRCFCTTNNDSNDVDWDITKIEATPETLAALFGVKNPETLVLLLDDKDNGSKDKVVPLVEEQVSSLDDDGNRKTLPHCFWPLEPGKRYQVLATSNDIHDDNDDDHDEVIPMSETFALFPGANDDEKSDRLHSLSVHFYDMIWNSELTPPDFRAFFYSRFGTVQTQAFRQYHWLLEVLGGPTLFKDHEERQSTLWPRVASKHASKRIMKAQHAITWLRLMKQALDDEFPEDNNKDHSETTTAKLKEQLGLYWLHFYAFFHYTDEERSELRREWFSSSNLKS